MAKYPLEHREHRNPLMTWCSAAAMADDSGLHAACKVAGIDLQLGQIPLERIGAKQPPALLDRLEMSTNESNA